MVDGISCAVEFGKWNPTSPIMFYLKYPECANTSSGWSNYTDTLFINVSFEMEKVKKNQCNINQYKCRS